MKLSDLDDSDIQKTLKITDFENFFNIFTDKRGNNVFNLNETLYLNINENLIQNYTCTHRMFWPLIAHKIYGSTRLAWILMKINNVNPTEIFTPKMPGDIVKYIPANYVDGVVADLNDFNG